MTKTFWQHSRETTREILAGLRRGDLEPFYRWGARWLMRGLYHPAYIDFDKIPETGPGIIIANHVSYLDGLVISAGVRRPVRYVIDQYIYEQPGVHYFMKLNRAVPVEPTRDSVTAMLDTIAEGLEQGDMFCIFPEGQLTYTGYLGHFKPGVEWIIQRTPVPVYPIALKGLWGSIFSRKYLRAKWRWMPRSFLPEVTAICGEPIPPDQAEVRYMQRVILALKHTLELPS